MAGMGLATGAAVTMGPAQAAFAQDDGATPGVRGATACAPAEAADMVAPCPQQASGSLTGTLIVIFHGHLIWPWLPGGPLGGLLGALARFLHGVVLPAARRAEAHREHQGGRDDEEQPAHAAGSTRRSPGYSPSIGVT